MSKEARQTTVCDFIRTQYTDFRRLRFDVVSGKTQIRDLPAPTAEDAANTGGNDRSRLLEGDSEQGWRDITNADINDIICQITFETGLNICSREVLAVLQSHQIPHVHPLREWLLSLPEYTPEQGDWIGMLAAQVRVVPSADKTPEETDALWQDCFRKWFVAMVAAWMDDKVVNQHVLVLIGRQGIYKTTWLEHLIPPCLRAYSCKMGSARELSKDDRMRIAEFGLIALDEMDAISQRELNVLKSVITATDVNERAAYAYTKERKMRLASFCGSGNKREFLTDLTGNRRWLPFEVEEIQNPFYTSLPYTFLYAQALYLIRQGFNYWFERQEIDRMEQHNEDFRVQLNEEQLLSVYFDIPADDAPNAKFMTTAEISDKLVTYGNIKKPMALPQLGIVLNKAGFKAVRKRQGGGNQLRGWIVYERTADEINIERSHTES